MIIEGKKINIRAIEHEDMEFLREIINNGEFDMMENGYNFPVSKAQQKKWFEAYLDSGEKGRFIIETKQGNAVGYTCILNIDWKNRKAHTGIKLATNEYRENGMGKDAVLTIMHYCFMELQLNRLEGFILDYNDASKKLYIDKCGWSEEGRQRKAVYKNGAYLDLILVGILKEEYEKILVEEVRTC